MALTFMQGLKDEKSIKGKSIAKNCLVTLKKKRRYKAKQWGKNSRYPLMKDCKFSDDTQPIKNYQIVMKKI